MKLILMFAVTVICAIGWLKYYIATLALTHYMITNNCEPPTDYVLKTCSEYVVDNLVRDIISVFRR